MSERPVDCARTHREKEQLCRNGRQPDEVLSEERKWCMCASILRFLSPGKPLALGIWQLHARLRKVFGGSLEKQSLLVQKPSGLAVTWRSLGRGLACAFSLKQMGLA
jgi:hypothetical protein